jgi:hypothetical protein
MKRFLEFFFPLILVTMFVLPLAHAATGGGTPAPAPAPAPVIDFSGIINAITGGAQGTTNAVNNTVNAMPNALFALFTNSLKGAVSSFNSTLLSLTGVLLASNPDPQLMFGLWQAIIIIISSLYLLVFLIVAFSFLMAGANIQKRENAKEWLKKAITMVICVNLSFIVYQFILELSSAITLFMWDTGFAQYFQPSIFSSLGLINLAVYSGVILITLVTLFVRFLFLLAGVALFPIGIFLYLTPKLEEYGKLIFSFLGMILAMQFVDVIILIASNQIGLQMAGQAGAAFIPALGFLVVAIANIFMMTHAIMKSANKIADSSPVFAMAMNTVTTTIKTAAVAAAA